MPHPQATTAMAISQVCDMSQSHDKYININRWASYCCHSLILACVSEKEVSYPVTSIVVEPFCAVLCMHDLHILDHAWLAYSEHACMHILDHVIFWTMLYSCTNYSRHYVGWYCLWDMLGWLKYCCFFLHCHSYITVNLLEMFCQLFTPFMEMLMLARQLCSALKPVYLVTALLHDVVTCFISLWHCIVRIQCIQWNLSNPDTLGMISGIHFIEVSWFVKVTVTCLAN